MLEFYDVKTFSVKYVFQPIVNAKSGLIYGYEALMRPNDETPENMIRECVENGTLHRLESTSLFEAARQYKERNLGGRLFINSFPCETISRVEFEHFMKQYPDLYERLVIEILEYPYYVEKIMEKKREVFSGCMFALDDFGCGLNDVASLKLHTPDFVKLDRELIHQADRSKTQQLMLNIICDFLRKEAFHPLIVAEGVETKAEYESVKNAGVDLIQGFYTGRPG